MAAVPDSLQRLLQELGPRNHVDLPRFFEAVYRARYTGPILIHWLNGKPQRVDLGSPVRLTIVEGLDNREKTGSP